MGTKIVLIDQKMHVAKGEICTYNNKKIQIESLITVDGTLEFINCMIECSHGKIIVGGHLKIEGCEITGAENNFIHIVSEASAYLGSSKFKYNRPFTGASIIAKDTEKFIVENCSFQGTFLVMSKVLSMQKRIQIPSNATTLIDAKNGIFHICTFENFTSCRIIKAMELEDCIFDNCNTIQVGGTGEEAIVRGCKFRNCNRIDFYDSEIDWSEFDNVQSLYLESSNISKCTFSHIKCNWDHVIFLEDTDMTFCEFDDILLVNDSYLIDAIGDCWIWDSTFTNCKTSRDDLEIIHYQKQKKQFFRRKRDINIVDQESCIGLDHVIKWKGEGRI